MSFKESFETVSKEEVISDAIDNFKKEEKDLYNNIDNKEDATEKNTIKESMNYKFLKNNSDILDLMDSYGIKLDAEKKNIYFEVNMPNREEGTIKGYNNYEITLTKKGASIAGGKLEIPGLFNDEEYNTPQKIDIMVDKIYNRILEEEKNNDNLVTDQTQENLENKMNAVKKICKKLFQ